MRAVDLMTPSLCACGQESTEEASEKCAVVVEESEMSRTVNLHDMTV